MDMVSQIQKSQIEFKMINHKLNGFNNGRDTTEGIGGNPGPFILYKNKQDSKVEGYWYSKREPQYPMPISNVLSIAESSQICELIWRKEKLAKEGGYLGDSISRLTGETLGNIEYELDGWIWPGDFAEHYVRDHGVRPTDAFLKFIGWEKPLLSEYERGVRDGKIIDEHDTTCWQE